MKIKCPGCAKVLSIPATAAGKLVKCPCGKQLRAPSGTKTAATPQARPAAQKPSAQKQAPARPAPKPAPRPAARPAAAAAAAPQLDDDLFGELTDQDLAPVKSVYSPGLKTVVAKGAPIDGEEEGKARNRSGGISPLKLGFGVLLIIGGGGLLTAYFMGIGFNDDDDGSVRIRRRSPIGIGIGLIITGFGWAAAGIKGGGE